MIEDLKEAEQNTTFFGLFGSIANHLGKSYF